MTVASMRALAISSAALLATSMAAVAQQQEPSGTQPQVAERCLADLTQFARQTNEEGFWITGWGGPGVVGAPPATTGVGAFPRDAATGAFEADSTAPEADPGAPVDQTMTGAIPGSPWGPAGVTGSPRDEMQVLYSAAVVLGRQGKQDGCEYLLAELQGTYQTYVTRLQDAGVDPAEVTSWRQERIALAQPVSELPESAVLTVDDLTGTDVRNAADEYLGSVADVIFDRVTGDIRYIVVARGGFLGIGEDHVPVPWERFSMAEGLNTLVLHVTEEEIGQAPSTAAGNLGPGTRYTNVDEFWGS
jgi:sporulation protein YlmC with PRC-barrel domain